MEAAGVCRVKLVRDRNKTDVVGMEILFDIITGINGIPSQPGEVLDNHTVNMARLNIRKHLLEAGAVKENPAVTVVNLFRHDFNLRVPGNVIIDQPPLVGDAVAFHRLIIGIRKTDVLNGFVNLHKKTLLSLRRKIPAIQEVWLCRIQFLFQFLLYHAPAGKSALFLK